MASLSEGAGSGTAQPLRVGFRNLLPAVHKLAPKLELLRGQTGNPAIQIPNPESSRRIKIFALITLAFKDEGKHQQMRPNAIERYQAIYESSNSKQLIF